MIFKDYRQLIRSVDTPSRDYTGSLRYENWTAIPHGHPERVLLSIIECIHDNQVFVVLYPNENPEEVKPQIDKLLTELAPERIDFFMRSSGSSGRPKFVARTLDSWIRSFSAHRDAFGLSSTKSVFIPGPMVYSANLYHSLLSVWLHQKVYLCQSTHTATQIKAIQTYAIDTLFTVPTRLDLLFRTEHNLVSIKKIITVGERLQSQTIRFVIRNPHVEAYHYYGASELGQVSFATYDEILHHSALLGRPFDGVKIGISKTKDIIVTSEYAAIGYKDQGTVFDKGDLIGGLLYFKGRTDEQLNHYGRKIDLTPVRELLQDQPSVKGYCLRLHTSAKKEHYSIHIHSDEKLNESVVQSIHRIHKPSHITYYKSVVLTSAGKCDWNTTIKKRA